MNEAYKKLTSHGSVSIPVQMRREMGLEPKDPVVVTVDDKNNITISPYNMRCIFCGTQEGVRSFKNKGFCSQCASQILKIREDR